MTAVTLTDAAIRHLAADPKLEEWKREKANVTSPILGYYQRSYFTSNSGDVTEFGDGFMLTFDRKDIDWAEQGLRTTPVSIMTGVDILVVGPHSIFEDPFKIDWNKKKYTYDLDVPGPASTMADRHG